MKLLIIILNISLSIIYLLIILKHNNYILIYNKKVQLFAFAVLEYLQLFYTLLILHPPPITMYLRFNARQPAVS